MTVTPRASIPADQWDAFVDAHPAGWFFHRATWIDYCLAYHPGAIDRSFALFDDAGTLVALVPLVQEGDEAAMGGEPGAAPLVDPGRLWQVLHELTTALRTASEGLRRLRFRGHPGAEILGLGWFAADWQSWGTEVLDLRPEEPQLWRNVRKSYRYLVRRAEQTHQLTLHGPGNEVAAMTHAHQLHVVSAGRETRAPRTWELMTEWVRDGHALVALATPSAGFPYNRPTGFAYAIRYKHWAYYASGATTEKDLAHALQWALITTLRADGRHHYELGWHVRPWEELVTKAAGIARFKQGFGGSVWTVRSAEVTL